VFTIDMHCWLINNVYKILDNNLKHQRWWLGAVPFRCSYREPVVGVNRCAIMNLSPTNLLA